MMRLPLKSPASFYPIRPLKSSALHEKTLAFAPAFMFNISCCVPEMDGCCEAQSTTFNSFINQASVHAMNYWLSEFRGNSLFLFSPWWTCFAGARHVPGLCGITECLLWHTKGYKMTAERRAIDRYAEAIIQYLNLIFPLLSSKITGQEFNVKHLIQPHCIKSNNELKNA